MRSNGRTLSRDLFLPAYRLFRSFFGHARLNLVNHLLCELVVHCFGASGASKTQSPCTQLKSAVHLYYVHRARLNLSFTCFQSVKRRTAILGRFRTLSKKFNFSNFRNFSQISKPIYIDLHACMKREMI